MASRGFFTSHKPTLPANSAVGVATKAGIFVEKCRITSFWFLTVDEDGIGFQTILVDLESSVFSLPLQWTQATFFQSEAIQNLINHRDYKGSI